MRLGQVRLGQVRSGQLLEGTILLLCQNMRSEYKIMVSTPDLTIGQHVHYIHLFVGHSVDAKYIV